MLKKIILQVFSICFLGTFLQAQQLPLLSEYLYNGFLLNPALMGWEGTTAASVGYRHQWTDMKNAPRTANISFRHLEDGKNMGFGGYFVHDKTGPTSFTGLTLNYSYHIPLKGENGRDWYRNRICLGMSLSGLGYRLRGADLRYVDPNDPLIIQNNESAFLPDAGAGIMYFNDMYYFGISVPQMISMRVKFQDDLALSTIRRVAHFYINGGVRIKLYDYYNYRKKNRSFIVPSFWLKYAASSPFNINFNVNYYYNGIFSAGVGYGSEGSFTGNFQINFQKNYNLGYAFSYATSIYSPQLGSNHEIVFTYVFQSVGKGWFDKKLEGKLIKGDIIKKRVKKVYEEEKW